MSVRLTTFSSLETLSRLDPTEYRFEGQVKMEVDCPACQVFEENHVSGFQINRLMLATRRLLSLGFTKVVVITSIPIKATSEIPKSTWEKVRSVHDCWHGERLQYLDCGTAVAVTFEGLALEWVYKPKS